MSDRKVTQGKEAINDHAEQKRTLIAVPNMGDWKAEFGHSLFNLRKDGEMALQQEIGSLVYEARNRLAMTAINSESDYVMWLDADMIFPENAFLKMREDLEKPGVDIVSALYFRRIAPYTPVLYEKLDMSNDGKTVDYAEPKEVPADLFEVAGVGFGCLLMKTEIFRAVLGKHMQIFTPFATAGEDLAFCWRARDCGYRIWCDPTIMCGHVGKQIVTADLFLAYQEAMERGKK